MAGSAPSRTLPLRWIAEARDAIAGVLNPAPCRWCDVLLTHSSRIPVCRSCLDGFSQVPNKNCAVCGLALPDMTAIRG